MNMSEIVGPDRIANGKYWTKPWSLVEGCTAVSPGCDHCWSAAQSYMRQFQKNRKIEFRYSGLAQKYEGKPAKFIGNTRCIEEEIVKPFHNRKPQVFSVWNDLFHSDVPNEFREEVWGTMHRTPQHVYIICTKRPENIAPFFEWFSFQLSTIPRYLPNVILMTSAENQEMADLRLPHLIKHSEHFTIGVSIEPMLGIIQLKKWIKQLDWVVLGAETGAGARPMEPTFAALICCCCKKAKVPFFFKSHGSHKSFKKYGHKLYGHTQRAEFPEMKGYCHERRSTICCF